MVFKIVKKSISILFLVLNFWDKIFKKKKKRYAYYFQEMYPIMIIFSPQKLQWNFLYPHWLFYLLSLTLKYMFQKFQLNIQKSIETSEIKFNVWCEYPWEPWYFITKFEIFYRFKVQNQNKESSWLTSQ